MERYIQGEIKHLDNVIQLDFDYVCSMNIYHVLHLFVHFTQTSRTEENMTNKRLKLNLVPRYDPKLNSS